MRDKIIELETRYSFQEELLNELNKEVLRQQRQLQAIAGEMRDLRQQLADLQAREGNPGMQLEADEKPPHY